MFRQDPEPNNYKKNESKLLNKNQVLIRKKYPDSQLFPRLEVRFSFSRPWKIIKGEEIQRRNFSIKIINKKGNYNVYTYIHIYIYKGKVNPYQNRQTRIFEIFRKFVYGYGQNEILSMATFFCGKVAEIKKYHMSQLNPVLFSF